MDVILQQVASYGAMFVAALGVLAFITALIVQMTKELPGIVKAPTALLAMVVAFTLTLAVFFGGMAFLQIKVLWYMVVAAVIVAFIVWAIAEKGWAWVAGLWQRFRRDTEPE